MEFTRQRGAEASKVDLGVPPGFVRHLFPGAACHLFPCPKRRLVPCPAIRGGRCVRARRIPCPTYCGGWRDRSAIRPACRGQRDRSAVGHANVECPPSERRKLRQRTIPRRIWSTLPVRRIKSEKAVGTRQTKKEKEFLTLEFTQQRGVEASNVSSPGSLALRSPTGAGRSSPRVRS